MDTIRAWKDPEYRKSFDANTLPQHPSGLSSLDDRSLDDVAGGSSAPCATIGISIASIGLSVAICSPNGTACGSCGFGTAGCC